MAIISDTLSPFAGDRARSGIELSFMSPGLQRWRYDIDRLRRHFQVSYETTCHRLSTLQRPRKQGVPFFFMRVDRAGNISKRQSATDFHFSRVGGTCPLWNVYEAFAQPAKILRQLAQMPDGRTYLWIARAVSRPSGGFDTPDTLFSIGHGTR